MLLKSYSLLLIFILTALAKDGLEIPFYADTSAIVRHTGFTLEYNEKYEQAKWVAYVLTKDKVMGNYPRTDNFRADPLVITGSATLADYKNSGYDRGHLYPAADAAWDTNSMNDCFYLSNMTPQIHAFNAGIWGKLETQVRDWSYKFDSLLIVTGGILRDGLPTIGIDSVAVPEYFYKVILCKNGTDISGIGFILKSDNSSLPLKNFAVTIDSIERVTGIDFFPQLPDSIESKVEATIDTLKWFPTSKIREKSLPSRSNPSNSTANSGIRYFDLMGNAIKPLMSGRSMKLVVVKNEDRLNYPKAIIFTWK